MHAFAQGTSAGKIEYDLCCYYGNNVYQHSYPINSCLIPYHFFNLILLVGVAGLRNRNYSNQLGTCNTLVVTWLDIPIYPWNVKASTLMYVITICQFSCTLWCQSIFPATSLNNSGLVVIFLCFHCFLKLYIMTNIWMN